MLYELKRQAACSINEGRVFTLAHDYEDAINKFTNWLKRQALRDQSVDVNYDINKNELVRETEIEGLEVNGTQTDLIVTRYKVILRSPKDLLDVDLYRMKKRALKGTLELEDRRWIADIIDYILEARSTKPFIADTSLY